MDLEQIGYFLFMKEQERQTEQEEATDDKEEQGA